MTRTILITGSSRGIGAATARLAASQGWAVGVSYRHSSSDAQQVVNDIIGKGGKATLIKGDVGNEQDVVAMFDACEMAFSRVSGLVNNAGILEEACQLADMGVDRWNRVFQTNVVGSFLCAREAVRRMSTQRGGNGGAIVNVTSMASQLGGAHEFIDYAASKGAIDSITIGLAKECADQGIRVNSVRPGLIETEMHASGGHANRLEDLMNTVPMERAGQPEEVAEAIIWLLSDRSSYSTGTTISVIGCRC